MYPSKKQRYFFQIKVFPFTSESEVSSPSLLFLKDLYIWMFPKMVGFPPKSSHSNRVFHYKPSILGYPGTPIFENTHINPPPFQSPKGFLRTFSEKPRQIPGLHVPRVGQLPRERRNYRHHGSLENILRPRPKNRSSSGRQPSPRWNPKFNTTQLQPHSREKHDTNKNAHKNWNVFFLCVCVFFVRVQGVWVFSW